MAKKCKSAKAREKMYEGANKSSQKLPKEVRKRQREVQRQQKRK